MTRNLRTASCTARTLPLLIAVAAWAGCDSAPTDAPVASSPLAFASSANALDPALLTPNPIESSNPGTVWECRRTGDGAQCVGHRTVLFPVGPNGLDCSGQTIYTPSEQHRDQVRYYGQDLVETHRDRHDYGSELWSIFPDGRAPNVTLTWRYMDRISYPVPGDPNQGFITEVGSSFLLKAADGGRVLFNNAGLASGFVDFDTFHGHWPADLFGPVCAVLTGH